jgi:flagellar biosynthesis protein FliQ
MSPEAVVAAVRAMLVVGLTLLAPPLLTAIFVGFLVGLFQASTRINEMTLSFVPRFAAVLLVLYFTSSWAVAQLIAYIERSALAIRTFSG